jgi:Flp pilus assembly protein TadB
VSKERAERRAARQAERDAAAARRERAQARKTRRSALMRRWRPHDRRGRPDSMLAQRRRRQDASVAFVMLSVLVVSWILLDGWAARLTVVLISALAVPVLVTLLFDRRN